MRRKIYQNLLDWKNTKDNNKPLIILGARQVGKTYIINEFCKNEFVNYVKINFLENKELLNLYNLDINSENRFNKLKVLIGMDLEKENTVLFVDEIQESEIFISELKFICENYPNVKIVCAGSLLGVKLKRSQFSFPVGKVNMIQLFPLDFEEFLMSLNEDLLIKEIRKCYESNQEISLPIHEKCINYYRIYNICGGMPESVLNIVNNNLDVIKYDKQILSNIVESYFKDMDKYVSNNAEALKNERIYKSIPYQIANDSKKFQYSKVSKGAKSRDYELPLDWLLASNIVLKSDSITLPEIPLKGFIDVDTFKLFINDIGILNYLLDINYYDILADNLSLYKGPIAENYVATQLSASSINLCYWKSDNTSEIDFLIYTKDGIIPLEVKSGLNLQSKSLNVYKDKYNPKYSIKVSLKDFGYNKKDNIKYIPLYAIFCIEKY